VKIIKNLKGTLGEGVRSQNAGAPSRFGKRRKLTSCGGGKRNCPLIGEGAPLGDRWDNSRVGREGGGRDLF